MTRRRLVRRVMAIGGTLAAVLALGACTDLLVGSQPGTSPDDVFDTIWQDFDRYYVFFNVRGVDWNAMSTRYRPLALQASNDTQLATVIGQLFAELHDEHVDLVVPPGTYYRSVDFSSIHTYFDPTTVKAKYVPGLQSTSDEYVAYGMIDPNIGYVWLPTFSGSGWTGDIDRILASMPTARSVIIDIRNNGGGASDNAEAIAARFMDSTHVFAYEYYRDGPGHSDFSPDVAQTIAPGGATRFAGPVAVLVNRGDASASEHFVLAMRLRPHTTFVGDTTAGAMGNPVVRELANGWSYRVPLGAEVGPSRESYEGIGIPPTLFVSKTAADSIAARDPQLDAAISLLRGTGP